MEALTMFIEYYIIQKIYIFSEIYNLIIFYSIGVKC